MRAYDWLKRLAADRRGNALVVGAACLPLMIGAAALGVDTIYMTLSKRQLQRSADSGALAGAYALVQNKTVADSVNRDLQLNNSISLTGSPTIENAPTTGSYAGNGRAVRVALTANIPMAFWSVFSNSSATIKAEATAAVIFNGQFCMLSLEDGNTTGVTFTGSAAIDLGCGVASNSKSANAITAGGSSLIKATPISAVGGVPSSTHYASPTTLLPYSPKQADPYAALPVPTVPSGCKPTILSAQSGKAPDVPVAVSPGVYCYKSYDFKGTITLPSGIYYVNGGDLGFGAQANVTCLQCTFILTSSTASTDPTSVASVTMNGGAVMNLTAPKSGTYEGVLIYQDPRAPLGNTITINGNSASVLEGGFYFPRAYLTMNGTAGMTTRCIQLVARRLDFSGNASVDNTCPTDGGAKAFDMILVRLVA
ncbi:MAG TPA: pilus assembly protein TadG-related protein [Allosphingosinicella sp.]|nr:pilus assembly protein TadG-related protein [Allosphingosinicella sp.]